MVDGSDIYGDGVNIAARLQELAEPGGVVVSASVYDQVHNKMSVGFDRLGQQPMKNVGPVLTYRVAMAGGAAAPRSLPVDEGATPQREAPSRAGASGLSQWFANLPRDVEVLLVIAGFLVLLNVFTGLKSIWFHWPVAALLFVIILRILRRRGPQSDRKEDR